MTACRPLPLLLLGFGAIAACAAKPAAPPAAPPAASAAPPAPTPPIPPAPTAAAPIPFDFSQPAGAAITFTVDLAKLARADAPPTFASLQYVLEDVAGLPHAPSLHDLFAGIGLDDRRPVTMAVLAPDEQARRAIAALTALVPATEPERRRGTAPPAPTSTPFYAPMRAAIAPIPVLACARVLVPATDPARVRAAIDAAMKKDGWEVGAPGQYARRHAAATATLGEDVVALDFATGDDPREGLAAIRAAATAKHAEATTTGDAVARLSYSPSLVAEQSFLTGVTTTIEAVSGGSIRPDQRERIAAEGLWESAQSFTLAKGPRGERWSHVDLSLSLQGGRPALTMRADAGPGFEVPAEAAWAPSFSVTSTATGRLESPSFDVSRAFLASWKLPGGADGASLATKPFLDLVHSSGSEAMLVALPDLAVTAPGMLDGHDELAPKPEVLARFARFGLTQGGSVFYGVLPDGTTRANAECVLVGPAPCGAHKLALGAAGKDADARVSLVQIERRFVLLRTNDQDGLAVKLKGTATGPVRASLDLQRIPLFGLATLPFTAVETVRHEGNVVVAEIAVH